MYLAKIIQYKEFKAKNNNGKNTLEKRSTLIARVRHLYAFGGGFGFLKFRECFGQLAAACAAKIMYVLLSCEMKNFK